MPIPQLYALNVMLGLGCAWLARAEIRLASRSAIASVAFGVLLIGEVLLMLPMGLYLYLFYPDWSWMYLVEAREVPSAVVVFVMGGYLVAATAGYFGAVALCRASRETFVLWLIGALGFIVVLTLAIGYRRFGLVGTFEQYHRLFGLDPMTHSGLGAFLLLAIPALGGAWGWGLHRLRKASTPKIEGR